MFIGVIFSLIIIILSEIGTHIIIDLPTSSLTITPTPLLPFLPPKKKNSNLSSLSQHVSATPLSPIFIRFVSFITPAILHGLYKLLTFHVPTRLQSLDDGE